MPQCTICHRKRPQIGFHLLSRDCMEETACCMVCKKNPLAFTHENNNDPSPPPLSEKRCRDLLREGLPLYCGPLNAQHWYDTLFRKASLTEELLVTRFRTFMIMRRMPHRHLRYRGHTIAFMQVSRAQFPNGSQSRWPSPHQIRIHIRSASASDPHPHQIRIRIRSAHASDHTHQIRTPMRSTSP